MVVRFKVPSPRLRLSLSRIHELLLLSLTTQFLLPAPARSRQCRGRRTEPAEADWWVVSEARLPGPQPARGQTGRGPGRRIEEREREDTSHRTEDGCSIVPAAWLPVTGLQMSYLYMLVYTMCCVEANITIISHHPLPRPRLFPLCSIGTFYSLC